MPPMTRCNQLEGLDKWLLSPYQYWASISCPGDLNENEPFKEWIARGRHTKVSTRTNTMDFIPTGYGLGWKVVQKKDNSKLVVCEIIVSHIRAIFIEVYIKYKISLFRDWDVIAFYEVLYNLDVEIDPLAKNRVVEIYIREDSLK